MLTISPVERLHELGGVATRGTLLRACGRVGLDRAVAAGDVVRIARGRYALPMVDDDARAVARLGGVLALTSAALHHGWAVKRVPDRPHVVVSRGRRVSPGEHAAYVHRAELRPHEVTSDGVTTPEVTLTDCLRRLPFDEALAVADSALRIVAEADSFAWHGGREQLSADARRYDLLVVHGWLVLSSSVAP